MKKFFMKACLFVLISTLLSVLIVFYSKVASHGYISFLNSVSYDGKLFTYRSMPKDQNTIVIGSSISLNNFSGETFYRNYPNESFYNLASWGLKNSNINDLLEATISINKPQSVIVFSQVYDFGKNGPQFADEQFIHSINKYLRGESDLKTDLMHYLSVDVGGNKYQKFLANYNTPRDQYISLQFDRFGSVPLEITKAEINEARWNEKIDFVFQADNPEYKQLRRMAKMLKEQGITLYFVQTPYRKGALNRGTDGESIQKHIALCRDIVEESGQIYYDAIDFDAYTDEYFVDASHMNSEGAKRLTQDFIDHCYMITHG